MPVDPRRLNPGELCRLLNSTPLGPVPDERQLPRHRMPAGYPEVCRPVEALDGIANRCAGQLYRGERTHSGWAKRRARSSVVFRAGRERSRSSRRKQLIR